MVHVLHYDYDPAFIRPFIDKVRDEVSSLPSVSYEFLNPACDDGMLFTEANKRNIEYRLKDTDVFLVGISYVDGTSQRVLEEFLDRYEGLKIGILSLTRDLENRGYANLPPSLPVMSYQDIDVIREFVLSAETEKPDSN